MKGLATYVLGAVLALGSANYAVAEGPTTRPAEPQRRQNIYHHQNIYNRGARSGEHRETMQKLIEKFKDKKCNEGLLKKLHEKGRASRGKYGARHKSDGKSGYGGKKPETRERGYDPKARADRIRDYFAGKREEAAKKYGAQGKRPKARSHGYDPKAMAERREKIKTYFEKKREEAKKGGDHKYDPRMIEERIKKARKNFAKYIKAREKKIGGTKKKDEGRDSRSHSFKSRSSRGRQGHHERSSSDSRRGHFGRRRGGEDEGRGHHGHGGRHPGKRDSEVSSKHGRSEGHHRHHRRSRKSESKRSITLRKPTCEIFRPITSKPICSTRLFKLAGRDNKSMPVRRPMCGISLVNKAEIKKYDANPEITSCGKYLAAINRAKAKAKESESKKLETRRSTCGKRPETKKPEIKRTEHRHEHSKKEGDRKGQEHRRRPTTQPASERHGR
jgi:hypothetical protein